MARKRQVVNKEEPNGFIFKETLSGIPLQKNSPPRDLEQELFGKKGVKEIVDDLETQLGYKRKVARTDNLKYYNVIVDPTDAEDQEILNRLMNDKEVFNIMKWSEFSTNRTGFQIFIVYSENQDALERKKKLKEANESNPTP